MSFLTELRYAAPCASRDAGCINSLWSMIYDVILLHSGCRKSQHMFR